MAGPNSTSAFVNIQAPQGSIADVINQQENIEFRYRQEERQNEQIRYQRQKEKEEWRDRFLKENLKDQTFLDVGNVELNYHAANAVSKAQEEAGKIASEMVVLKNSGKGSSPEYNRLFTKLHTLNQTSDMLKQAISPMSNLIKEINEGKYHNDDGLISTLKDLQNAEVGFDEKGKISLQIKDPDGSVRSVSYADMVKGKDAFDLVPKVSLDKIISETVKGIGKERTVTQNGYEDITKEGISEQTARQAAETMLFSEPGGTKLTNTAKSWLKENGYDYKNPDPDVLQNLANSVTEKIIMSKDRVDETKLDRSAKTADANLAQRKAEHAHKVRQDAIDNGFKREELDSKNKEKTGGLFFTNPNNSTYANNKNVDPKSKAISLGKPLSIGTLEASSTSGKKNYEDAKLYSITYGKDGRAVIEIDYQGKESYNDESGETTEKGRKKATITINSQNEDRVAHLLGTDVQTLRSQLEPKKEVKKEDLRNKYGY